MSESHLPENLADWPDDPFALLGVTRNADERTLKRAYARLIRCYKPEHAPAEFRRVRDAYEAAQQMLLWGRIEHSWSDGDDDAVPGDEASSNTGEVETWERSSPALELSNRLQQIWQTVIDGDCPAADRTLAELQQTHPHDVDIAVRRYWLRRIDSSLDDAPALERLAPVVLQHGVGCAAGTLYLEELQRTPQECLSDRCRAVIDDPRSRPYLPQLLRPRWAGAAVRDKWSLIIADLERLKPQFFEDTHLWLELQLEALDQSVWFASDGARRIVAWCRSEFAEHEGWALNAGHLFDHFDALSVQASDMAETAKQTALFDLTPVMELTALLGGRPAHHDARFRRQLQAYMRDWLDNPLGAINALDRIVRRTPVALTRLLSLIDTLPTSPHRYQSLLRGDELRAILQDDIDERRYFSDLSNTASYAVLRQSLLSFCLDEFADVDDVAAALVELFPYLPAGENSWMRRLAQDLPLRCVVRYWLVSWS